MNFTELLTEFYSRGTDYLSEDAAGTLRAGRWVNQAYFEILNIQAWPFLEASTTGTSGAGFVSIPDLRRIRWVRDVSGSPVALSRVSPDDLAYDEVDFTQTGTPEYYYVEFGNTVRAYPVGGTVEVHYIKRVNAMTGTDTPLFREDYHDLIIDRAMVKAYKDSDNFEAAAALQQEFNAGLLTMAEDYQLDSRDVQYLTVEAFDG